MLTAARRMVTEEVMETARVRYSLKKLTRTIAGIYDEVESTPDKMGNFVADELRDLEIRVRGATVQSMKRLCKSLRAAVASTSRGRKSAIKE